MNITELISPERVRRRTDIGSKKRVLEHVSELLAMDTVRLGWNESSTTWSPVRNSAAPDWARVSPCPTAA